MWRRAVVQPSLSHITSCAIDLGRRQRRQDQPDHLASFEFKLGARRPRHPLHRAI